MYQREVLVVVNYICTVVLYSLFFFSFYEIYILAPTVIKEKRIVRKSLKIYKISTKAVLCKSNHRNISVLMYIQDIF